MRGPKISAVVPIAVSIGAFLSSSCTAALFFAPGDAAIAAPHVFASIADSSARSGHTLESRVPIAASPQSVCATNAIICSVGADVAGPGAGPLTR